MLSLSSSSRWQSIRTHHSFNCCYSTTTTCHLKSTIWIQYWKRLDQILEPRINLNHKMVHPSHPSSITFIISPLLLTPFLWNKKSVSNFTRTRLQNSTGQSLREQLMHRNHLLFLSNNQILPLLKYHLSKHLETNNILSPCIHQTTPFLPTITNPMPFSRALLSNSCSW